MQTANLATLLSHATPYEDWRTPIHPRLRQAAFASGPAILVCLIPLVRVLNGTLTPLLANAQAGDDRAACLWCLLCLLTLVDAVALFFYPFMLAATRGLQEGCREWHWLALGVAILGSIHGFALALALAAAVVIAVLTALMYIVFLMAAMAALLGMAAGSGS